MEKKEPSSPFFKSMAVDIVNLETQEVGAPISFGRTAVKCARRKSLCSARSVYHQLNENEEETFLSISNLEAVDIVNLGPKN